MPLGKLNMDEFAFGSSTETSAFGPTRNPWDLESRSGRQLRRLCGGGRRRHGVRHARLRHGRLHPPACQRSAASWASSPPTARSARYGVVAFGSSLDQVRPVRAQRRGRRRRDGRHVRPRSPGLHVAGRGGRLPRCMPSRASRACASASCPQLHGRRGPVRPRLRQRVSEAAAKLEAAGATIVEVDLPHIDAAISAYYVLGPCEAFSNLARFD